MPSTPTVTPEVKKIVDTMADAFSGKENNADMMTALLLLVVSTICDIAPNKQSARNGAAAFNNDLLDAVERYYEWFKDNKDVVVH